MFKAMTQSDAWKQERLGKPNQGAFISRQAIVALRTRYNNTQSMIDGLRPGRCTVTYCGPESLPPCAPPSGWHHNCIVNRCWRISDQTVTNRLRVGGHFARQSVPLITWHSVSNGASRKWGGSGSWGELFSPTTHVFSSQRLLDMHESTFDRSALPTTAFNRSTVLESRCGKETGRTTGLILCIRKGIRRMLGTGMGSCSLMLFHTSKLIEAFSNNTTLVRMLPQYARTSCLLTAFKLYHGLMSNWTFVGWVGLTCAAEDHDLKLFNRSSKHCNMGGRPSRSVLLHTWLQCSYQFLTFRVPSFSSAAERSFFLLG